MSPIGNNETSDQIFFSNKVFLGVNKGWTKFAESVSEQNLQSIYQQLPVIKQVRDKCLIKVTHNIRGRWANAAKLHAFALEKFSLRVMTLSGFCLLKLELYQS